MSRLQQDAVSKMLTDFEQASFVHIDPPPEAAGFRTSRSLPESGLEGLGSIEDPESTPVEESGDGGR